MVNPEWLAMFKSMYIIIKYENSKKKKYIIIIAIHIDEQQHIRRSAWLALFDQISHFISFFS